MTLSQKKALVSHFLAHCNRYADGKLAEYANRIADAPDAERPALEARIAEWRSYRAFNEHAIAELASDELDAWFEDFEPD